MSSPITALSSALRFGSTRIRLARHGCANRPFFHIVILQRGKKVGTEPIEQIGSFDPLPNRHNEKLVAIDVERLKYWLAQGSVPSPRVGQLLGLSGFLPVHPQTYFDARKRQAEAAAAAAAAATAAAATAAAAESQPPSAAEESSTDKEKEEKLNNKSEPV